MGALKKTQELKLTYGTDSKVSVLTIIGAGLACKRDRERKGRKGGVLGFSDSKVPEPTTVPLSINVFRGQACGSLYHQQFNRLPFAGWHQKHSPLIDSTLIQ